MLPLCPPSRPLDPGYPTRSRLLGDSALRRHALGVLAAAILAGCAGDPVPPPPPTGGKPVAPVPAPKALPGEAVAPKPVEPAPAPTPKAEPVPMVSPGIMVAPTPPPEPTPLRGKVAVDPAPPAPVKP